MIIVGITVGATVATHVEQNLCQGNMHNTFITMTVFILIIVLWKPATFTTVYSGKHRWGKTLMNLANLDFLEEKSLANSQIIATRGD